MSAFEAIMTHFANEPVLIVDGNPAKVCPLCGTLVLRTTLHIKWHVETDTQ